MSSSKCAVCGGKKSRLIKKQEAWGFPNHFNLYCLDLYITSWKIEKKSLHHWL